MGEEMEEGGGPRRGIENKHVARELAGSATGLTLRMIRKQKIPPWITTRPRPQRF